MDARILKFLEERNLLQIKECFEGFDFRTFKELEPHHLRDLVDKPSYRISLEIHLKSLKIQNIDDEDKTDKGSPEVDEEPVNDVDTLQFNELQDKEIELIEIQSQECASTSTVPTTVSPPPVACNTNAGESNSLVHIISAIDDFDMTILRKKYTKLGHFDSADRRRLSHCLIKFFVKHSESKTLTRAAFENISEAIVSIFPAENKCTYFIPSSGKIAAKGKLYQAYKTIRDVMATAGMIDKRFLTDRIGDTGAGELESDGADKRVISELDSLTYLKTHTDPNDELSFHWKNSRTERFRLIKEMDTSEYFETFPILAMANGFEWLDLDFIHSYPDAKVGVDRWNEILPKLLVYATSKSKKNPLLRALIKGHDQSINSQMLLSFKLLPFLLRTPAKPRKQKDNEKSSKLEVSNEFIPHFNTQADDKRTHSNFIDLKVIGSNSEHRSHVFVDNSEYVFENVLLGVDCAFKLYYIFNLEFPKPIKHVWDFINLIMYDIESQGCQSANFEVMSDIENTVI